jgi:hypothetical protein
VSFWPEFEQKQKTKTKIAVRWLWKSFLNVFYFLPPPPVFLMYFVQPKSALYLSPWGPPGGGASGVAVFSDQHTLKLLRIACAPISTHNNGFCAIRACIDFGVNISAD